MLGLLLLACAASRSSDHALRDEVLALPPTDVDGAVERIGRIHDPVERGLTVELWIRQNRMDTNRVQAGRLCDFVEPLDRPTCERHLSAVHLDRPQ